MISYVDISLWSKSSNLLSCCIKGTSAKLSSFYGRLRKLRFRNLQDLLHFGLSILSGRFSKELVSHGKIILHRSLNRSLLNDFFRRRTNLSFSHYVACIKTNSPSFMDGRCLLFSLWKHTVLDVHLNELLMDYFLFWRSKCRTHSILWSVLEKRTFLERLFGAATVFSSILLLRASLEMTTSFVFFRIMDAVGFE